MACQDGSRKYLLVDVATFGSCSMNDAHLAFLNRFLDFLNFNFTKSFDFEQCFASRRMHRLPLGQFAV